MSEILDNKDLEELMAILENMQDEELAVKLLAELNSSTKALGTLILNMNNSLGHEEWKKECDLARKRVEDVVKQIRINA